MKSLFSKLFGLGNSETVLVEKIPNQNISVYTSVQITEKKIKYYKQSFENFTMITKVAYNNYKNYKAYKDYGNY